MEKKWKSPQSIIVTLLILLIFSYMVIDFTLTKPKIEKEIKDVKHQYIQLSDFLNKKIPEIDSTFKIHAGQIKQQKQEMDTLKIKLDRIK
jgi:hypothetical protein